MHSRKLKAYLDLTRPVNVVITLLSIPAASILAGAKLSQWSVVAVASFTGGLVAAAANAINDYFDVDIDRTNKPSRPIPKGEVTKNEAWTLWLILSVIAIALNLFLSVYALGIVVFAVIILYWYSALFKRTSIIGNLVVGLMTGMAFVYGAVVVGNPERSIMPALFAFLINIAREAIKDIEDIEGDKKEKAMTLPVKYGIKAALWLASAAIALLIVATIAAYQLNIYNSIYLLLVLIVDIFLLVVMLRMWRDQTASTMNRLSNSLKLCMVVGLVAIFFGSR